MYTIIGGDGKEYGPVTAEQVRSWMAGGRANLETKIRAAGDDVWKTIGDFPEILGGAPAPGATAAAAAGPTLFREVAKLDIISCYERSWALLKGNFWAFVGVSVLMSLFYAVLGYSQHKGVFFLTPVFNGVLSGGMYYYFLRKIRGQPATVGDLFAGFSRAFVALVVAGVLISILVTVGIICLVLPGIYLVVAYAFTHVLIIDRQLGFWEAMETSRRVVSRQWFRLLGLLLLCVPFVLIGIAAFVVGIFVAIPLITGAVVYAYEDLFGPVKPQASQPAGLVTPSA
jgi:hypothetical protein